MSAGKAGERGGGRGTLKITAPFRVTALEAPKITAPFYQYLRPPKFISNCYPISFCILFVKVDRYLWMRNYLPYECVSHSRSAESYKCVAHCPLFCPALIMVRWQEGATKYPPRSSLFVYYYDVDDVDILLLLEDIWRRMSILSTSIGNFLKFKEPDFFSSSILDSL